MKKLILLSGVLAVFGGWLFLSCRQTPPPSEKSIAQIIGKQVDSFAGLCTRLRAAVESDSASEQQIKDLFLQLRLAYKRFEWAAEYFVPATSSLVNGPPVQEVEMPEIRIIEPAGLQVMEGLIFPKYDVQRKKELIVQLNLLKLDCDRYKTFFGNIDIFDWQVFDATKLEIFRLMTLGITGFDNPLTLKSMPETMASLESMQQVFSQYNENNVADYLERLLESAIIFCRINPDFNSFNRMEFIIRYGNPVTSEITSLEEKLKIHIIRYNRLLNQDAKTLFDTGAFNVNAYAPDHSSFTSDRKIALGKRLFSDPILSGTGKRSCQSCHQPERAFTDGLVRNTIIDRNVLLERNTPTLINAALQPALFYDLRVNSLEDQSLAVVQSSREMHGSMILSVQLLWKDKIYRQQFLDAFPYEDKNSIDTFEVMNAIGSYIRSLVYLNSRFDEYMRGSNSAMNRDEINGFNLFMGKAKCATCHFMPLFSGVFPPRFIKMEMEVIGVPGKRGENKIDPDEGRYGIVKVESQRHAFKIPTVRNASLTAPYMHNGVFSTLDQVVDFYNKGGGAGLGIHLANQTLPTDTLGLTVKETNEIIAFIKTLDSKIPAD